MSDIRVIVPENLKADVRVILQQQDLTISQAIRLFLREIVAQGKVPLVVGQHQPNAETRAAMHGAANPSRLRSYASADEMFSAWDADA